jgi:hypothetical protein
MATAWRVSRKVLDRGESVKALKKAYWVLPLLLLAASSVYAGSIPANVYFSGGYAFADNGFGIPPYQGTLNGQSALFYCVDFSHEIYGNTSWSATVTGLNASNGAFSSTRLDNKKTYLEMAWLITHMNAVSNQTEKAEYQWAVWSFSGGKDPFAGSDVLIGDALAAVSGGFGGKGWEILTPTGSYGQEFLVADQGPLTTATPEPSGMLLFGTVMLGMAFALRKKWPAPDANATPPAAE